MSRNSVILVLIVLGSCGSPDRPAVDSTDTYALAAEKSAAMQAILEIDDMRSSLAAGMIGLDYVDQQTFAQVCKPVGARLKQTAGERGWDIGQVAAKYRNPAHAPDAEAEAIFSRFRVDESLDSLWLRTEIDGVPGWRYLRRITVEPACLACHGQREHRPGFIKENYPEDRAFGFETGDLRGLYSVFIPDESQGEGF